MLAEPAVHSACDVCDVTEAILEHPVARMGTADSGGAENVIFFVLWEAGRDVGPAAEGEELAAIDVGHEEFVLLAHVEEDSLKSGVEDGLEF